MAHSAKLGGFKVLKDVVRISPVFSKESNHFPAELSRILAEEAINLPYLTCLDDGRAWGLNIALDAADGIRAAGLIEASFGRIFSQKSHSVVLSVFPHRLKPEIAGSLLEAFGRQGVEPDGLANSPSAISIILKEDILDVASEALFEPFSFSAYRTPTDWKQVQKGKEKLYKEVVASYQEQRPRVYGLEIHQKQALFRITLDGRNMGPIGIMFKALSQLGLNLSFLATGPCREKENGLLAFCIPASKNPTHTEIINGMTSVMDIASVSPVAVFFMNGPHFGDRYGIASELLTTFRDKGVDLLGLSCTIASITGIVHSHQLESAVEAIEAGFDVPSINKRGR